MEAKSLGGLVLLVVLLFVILGVFFFKGGLTDDVKDSIFKTIDWAKQFLPSFGISMDELSSDASVTAEHNDQILSLNQTIWKMLESTDNRCFENFGDFSDLGENGASLTFTQTASGVDLTVMGGAGGKQIDTNLMMSFPGMKLCVIAGPDKEADNFFSHYVRDKTLESPYYSSVSGIEIYYTTDGNNGNLIRVPEFGSGPVNDENDNFESEGWLFTPDNEHICFFPTNWNINADRDGIANEWFKGTKEDSIPSKAALGNLCS